MTRRQRATGPAALGVLAVVVAVQELAGSELTARLAPGALGLAALAVSGAALAGSGRSRPGPAELRWGVAALAGLTGLAQLTRAALGTGVNPPTGDPSHLLLAAAGAVTLGTCAVLARTVLARSTGGWRHRRLPLDGLVALVGAALLVQTVLPRAAAAGGSGSDVLLTVAQPVLAVGLCAAGAVLLCVVPAGRDRAAGWLLVSLCSTAVVAGSGSLAVGSPARVLDVVTSTAQLAALAAAVLALTAGSRSGTGAAPPAVTPPAVTPPAARPPLHGVVLAHGVAAGAVLLVLGGWAAGAAVSPAGAGLLVVAVLLAVVRTAVWAVDVVRLARTPAPAGSAPGSPGAAPERPVAGEVPAASPRQPAGRGTPERELERLAYTDYLTGLPNRARLMAELEAAAAGAARGEAYCLLLLDLDGFKAVNDVAGHDAGDHLLCEIADVLRAGARDGDLVARLGGDEFALLVPGPPAEGAALAERLVHLLDRSFRAPAPGGAPGPVFPVSGSIGVAVLRPRDEAPAAVRHADLALRAAKAAGKGCVRSSGEAIDSAMGRRARLARDLPAALAEQQLRLVYQPVVGVVDRKVLGLEALVRWEHPVLGTVPPDEFIALAEDEGLIVPLQQWVIGTALADAAELFRDGHRLQIGVNVSVRHLQAGCLVPDVARALAASGVPAGNLILDITESVVLEGQDRIAADLATLREMGCILALDDFGRGWSSLAYLARLPVHILKMDREFVADIERDPRGATLVAGVIELGRSLGLDVVAEGVETAGQAAVLQGMGCRYLQGYLIGRPVPVEQVRAVVRDFDPALLGDGDPIVLDAVSTW